MNTFTTTFKVQPAQGGLAVLHFDSEAKDRATAERRNMQKLFNEFDDEFDIVSTTTKAGTQSQDIRSLYRAPLKDKRARY